MGGVGPSAGGPGTTYIEISDGISFRRMLRIDGGDTTTGSKVFLDEPGGYYQLFDEIEIKRKASVSLQQVY